MVIHGFKNYIFVYQLSRQKTTQIVPQLMVSSKYFLTFVHSLCFAGIPFPMHMI